MYIRMVKREEFTYAVNSKSIDFKKFVIDSLMKKFVGIHLKTNKQIQKPSQDNRK